MLFQKSGSMSKVMSSQPGMASSKISMCQSDAGS
jgi:hypothetical protein